MSLLLLDLFFVAFDSANLYGAFQALTDDNWACRLAVSQAVTVHTAPYFITCR